MQQVGRTIPLTNQQMVFIVILGHMSMTMCTLIIYFCQSIRHEVTDLGIHCRYNDLALYSINPEDLEECYSVFDNEANISPLNIKCRL